MAAPAAPARLSSVSALREKNRAHIECNIAKTPQASIEYKNAKHLLSNARQNDMNQLKAEAVDAGFIPGNSIYGSNQACFFLHPPIVLDTFCTLVFAEHEDGIFWDLQIYRQDTKHLSKENIELIGLTQEQVHFLEWSFEWMKQIGSYWDGQTPFRDLDEFIAHIKQNHEAIFSTHIKSASKKE